MNTRYKQTPELIGNLESFKGEEDFYIGDRVVGVSVRKDDGLATLDVRGYPKENDNLMIRIELAELVAALSLATLNAE